MKDDFTTSILEEVTLKLSKALEAAAELIKGKEETKIYTPEETAKILKVSKTVLYNDLLKREDFPCFSIGTRKYISKKGLDEWIDNQIRR